MLNEVYQGEENKIMEAYQTNTASVFGTVASKMEFSHEVYGVFIIFIFPCPVFQRQMILFP